MKQTYHIRLFSYEILAVSLLFIIAISAGFAALHVLAFDVPRAVFISLMGCTVLLLAAFLFKLFYVPFLDQTYPALFVNTTLIVLFSIIAIRLTSSSFSQDDEIYSWNMWAIQHYHGDVATFQFTKVAYPQLFSYWIASLYHAMGAVVMHSIPRFFLAIPSLILGISMIGTSRSHTWSTAIVSVLTLCWVMMPWYTKGLADPLMTSALALSASLLIAYSYDTQNLLKLILALICGVIAAATKQAGLLWSCFSLPIIVIFGCWFYKWPKISLGFVVITFAIALIWPLWIAPNFIDNQGVISASIGNRTYAQQIVFAAEKHLLVLIFILASAIASWRQSFLRLLTLVAIAPMLIAWLLFGAYSRRLGLHVLALSGVIWVSALLVKCPLIESTAENVALKFKNWYSNIFLSVCLIIIYFIILYCGVHVVAKRHGTDLSDGAKSTLLIQFGMDSKTVIESILSLKPRIWTTSNYSFGPFYGRVPVGFPNYANSSFSIQTIKDELIKFRADYAVYSGVVPHGPASDLLKALADSSPTALIPILKYPTKYGFILYKVNMERLIALNNNSLAIKL